MKLENRCLVPADLETTWDLVMDIPKVAWCVPGLQELNSAEDGGVDAIVKVRVGPMSLNFSITIRVLEQDRERRAARFQVGASDRRVGGSLVADIKVRLYQQPQGDTELAIDTDVSFIGKLGELGQPVIRRKASATLQSFADNLAKQVAPPSA